MLVQDIIILQFITLLHNKFDRLAVVLWIYFMSECLNICWPMFYFHCWLVVTAAKLIRATFSVTYSGHVTALLVSQYTYQGQSGSTLQQKLLIGIRSTFHLSVNTQSGCQCSERIFFAPLWLQWMKMWFHPAVRPTTNQQK